MVFVSTARCEVVCGRPLIPGLYFPTQDGGVCCLRDGVLKSLSNGHILCFDNRLVKDQEQSCPQSLALGINRNPDVTSMSDQKIVTVRQRKPVHRGKLTCLLRMKFHRHGDVISQLWFRLAGSASRRCLREGTAVDVTYESTAASKRPYVALKIFAPMGYGDLDSSDDDCSEEEEGGSPASRSPFHPGMASHWP